ncbi:MAG: hypothetical protein SGI92_17390 [Bryobacteraceae bacterium]|nr:hypothetical protein [Bryobacteraceae bacterium]
MTPLERLHAVAATLPAEAVEALLVLAEQIPAADTLIAAGLFPRLATLPEEDVDEPTTEELTEALRNAGRDGWASQEEVERKLGLQ